MKSVYELKHFKSSTSRDLLKALKLYSDNIEPAYRTDTKEIMYWIDNFKVNSQDSFFVFGFYLNEILIGFAELAYFKTEKIVVADYLVIDKPYRGMNTFSEFIHKIKEFLIDQKFAIDYVIGEVGCFFERETPPESSQLLIRLLKMAKFRVVKTKHYVPRLGMDNYESEMMAVLMIYSADDVKQLKKQTYFVIIETLYYKYYQRWYDEFLNEKDKIKYKVILENLLLEIRKFTEKKDTIEINGSYNLWEVDISYMKATKANKKLKFATVISFFIIIIIGFGIIGLFVQKRSGIDIGGQAAIIMLAVSVTVIIVAALFEKRSSFVSNIIDKILESF